MIWLGEISIRVSNLTQRNNVMFPVEDSFVFHFSDFPGAIYTPGSGIPSNLNIKYTY